ncbi:unnamed protein product [Hydatigera taeniaeformis]|uniref:DNA-directed RNA polymerase n=1 Tax=Hydatigena taeniaeformis TaxID=6205 RepID=A0A0R3WVD7_HYDTA|nr:unnamed protein product [Hydatigera taeniaeformis]
MEAKVPQPVSLPVVYDCREDFLSYFAGKAFSTFEAFSKELQAFEEATGMQYMMKRTCLFNEGTLGREYLIYRYMHYACVRHVRPASKMGQRICSRDAEPMSDTIGLAFQFVGLSLKLLCNFSRMASFLPAERMALTDFLKAIVLSLFSDLVI